MRSFRAGGAHACCVRVCETEPVLSSYGTGCGFAWVEEARLQVSAPGQEGAGLWSARCPGRVPAGRAGGGGRGACRARALHRGTLPVEVIEVTGRLDQSSHAWEACRENTRKVLREATSCSRPQQG